MLTASLFLYYYILGEKIGSKEGGEKMKSKKITKTKTILIVGVFLLLVAGLLGAIYLSQRPQNLASKAASVPPEESCTSLGPGWLCCIAPDCYSNSALVPAPGGKCGLDQPGGILGVSCYYPGVPKGGDVCKSYGADWECVTDMFMWLGHPLLGAPAGGCKHKSGNGGNSCTNLKLDVNKGPYTIFVSSAIYDGSELGLGADRKCQDLAKAAGISWAGTFHALMSIGGYSGGAKERVWGVAPAAIYKRVDGVTVANANGIFSGRLLNPINVDERGTAIPNNYRGVWTGTDKFGNQASDCNRWTTNSSSVLGTYGDAGSTVKWLKNGGEPGDRPGAGEIGCSWKLRFYCFGFKM